MSEDSISATQLEAIAERALSFQRYVFRRSWGIYYAIWAAAITGFTFFVYLPLPPGLPQYAPQIIFSLLYGGAGILAGVASVLIFKNAIRTLRLRRALNEARSDRRFYWVLIGWWFAFYVVIGVSFTFFSKDAFSILYASLFFVEIFIYNQLRLSFAKRIPFEGKLALISYGFATSLSFAISLFSQNPAPYAAIWGVTIAVWLFCALYALTRAPDELAALVY